MKRLNSLRLITEPLRSFFSTPKYYKIDYAVLALPFERITSIATP